MIADVIQEKTAVFSFGSLSRTEEPRLYDLDEPTRELPLIAGRFAGREWTAEELRRSAQSMTAECTRSALFVRTADGRGGTYTTGENRSRGPRRYIGRQ